MRNFGCRITEDIKIHDMNSLVMENEKLRITFLLDKGADIVELLYKPKDIDFMWRSPVEFHNPAKCNSTTGSSLHNYLDHNFGGWQEILPSGGPECNYKGAVIGMHGEVSNLPWQYRIIKDTKEEISVMFLVRTVRSPFYLEKTITIKSNESTIYFDETLSNLANEDMELMWGHHPTIGEGFLDESCYIDTSAKKVFTYGEGLDFDTQRLEVNSEHDWPMAKGRDGKSIDLSKVPDKNAGTADMLFLKDFGDKAYYSIYSNNKNVGFRLKWDNEIFPYAWIWLVCKGSYGYPWYGNTYNLAIEPWTSYPGAGLTKAIDNGTALKMKAKEKIDFKMQVDIYEKGL
ncbi:aldose 1-epimerase [Vallitalea guaymasensis]|uniref:aldose 1-epimerase n=1 Tax=Vallitalea guaymasensis TaxID=1185412 RepID=UPI00272D578E|nr:aldose 1-epimerase [Vallitalea guaymasensis]